MKSGRALVLGSGPAGLAFARLLLARGWQVDLRSDPPRRTPVVVTLNALTCQLLRELFGVDAGALPGAHALAGRCVRWDDGQAMLRPLPSTALPLASLSAALAAGAMEAGLRSQPAEAIDPPSFDWVVDAAGRHGGSAVQVLRFGARAAVVARVRLAARAPSDRCTMEAVAGGWVFLIPLGGGDAVLQAVSAMPFADAAERLGELLEASTLLRPWITAVDAQVDRLEAMPRLRARPAGAGCIAIGDAALALDPLSGDGIGCGLRSAILAAAVVDAIRAGEDAKACTLHYARRLQRAAVSHVRSCIEHYRRAQPGRAWGGEIEAMASALLHCGENAERFAFRLDRGGLVRSRAPPVAAP